MAPTTSRSILWSNAKVTVAALVDYHSARRNIGLGLAAFLIVLLFNETRLG